MQLRCTHLTLAAMAAFALAGGSARGALNAYLSATGARLGEIKGSVTQKGRENTTMVIAMEHDVVSPRDPNSGLATGRRMHKPVTVTTEWDTSTLLFYNALFGNENLKTVEIDFWRPSLTGAAGTGAEEHYFTIKLTNASISDMKSHMLNNKNPELMKYAESVDISFTYQRIDFIWVKGGITSSDSWNGQASIPAPSGSGQSAVASVVRASQPLRTAELPQPVSNRTNEPRAARRQR